MNTPTLPVGLNAATPGWIVLKFGGTNVSTRARWDNIAAIAQRWRSCGKKVLIVVSALSGVTDRLRSIVDEHADVKACSAIAHEIRDRHHAMLAELGLPRHNGIDDWLARLESLLDDPQRAECALTWQANILALGEIMSSALGAAYLKALNIETCWLDAREHLLARRLPNQKAWSCFLSASVVVAPDAALAEKLSSLGDTFITQGFIARNADGETVLLGRGGSDTSASYFGVLLQAEKVEIWTDVAGMFSANPCQVPDARLLLRLDYEEAQVIAGTGAKVLQSGCITPLREWCVPLAIKDTNRPDLVGTEIADTKIDIAPSVKAISSRHNITLITMNSSGMWQQAGFLGDVFEYFKHYGLLVDWVSTSQSNVTVLLDPAQNHVDASVLSALRADLATMCRVKVIPHCVAITFVGRGMRSMLQKLSDAIAEFASLPVHLLSQSSDNLILTFVVEGCVAADLVPRLHALLIGTNAMRADDTRMFGSSWSKLYSKDCPTPALPWWRPRRAELLDLARECAPRYVYDLATVRTQAKTLREIGTVDRWFYSIGGNVDPQLLREIAAQGFGLECVSLGELGRLYAGLGDVHPDVLFAPNFAPRAVYASAFRLGARVTLDNLHPLAHWAYLFVGRDLMLRIDIGAGSGPRDMVNKLGMHSKCGLAMDQLDEFLRLARTRGARISGLRADLVERKADFSHWKEVYSRLATIAERIGGVRTLHIGRGLDVQTRRGEPPLDLVALSAALAEVKAAHPHFQLCVAPGRCLVADAGVLLALVTQVQRKGDVRYVGIETGRNALMPPPLYEAYHEMINLTRLDVSASKLVQIVGPIGESGEVLGSNRELPLTQLGDVLLIAQAGAHEATGSYCTLGEPAGERHSLIALGGSQQT